MKKIVAVDGFTLNPGDISWEGMEKLGDFTVYDRTTPEELDERVGDAHILLNNKMTLSRSFFASHPALEYVGILATGYNVVDMEAAKDHGVTVTNIPGYGSEAVAQHAIAFLLEITNRVGEHSDSVHAGDWNQAPDWCYWKHPLMCLAGKTMGIIGYGRIGTHTAKIAQALGMHVLVSTRTPKKELETETLQFTDQDTLFASADVIVLHCPLTPENTGMINKENIEKMKKGVIIINPSRGALIDEHDLAEALQSGHVYAAGLDVLTEEPPTEDNPLIGVENCFITPHIAWAAKESRVRLMDLAVENLEAYLRGEPVNVVS